MFHRKTSSAKPEPVQATSGRLEIEREGHVAYLEYTLAGRILQLIQVKCQRRYAARGWVLIWRIPRWSGLASRV